jgi:hypothetical protein
MSKLTEVFNRNNSDSIKFLEDIPESDWVFTPEEITQLGIDWKLYLEIFEIIDKEVEDVNEE